jgi:hypothetical protein
MSPQMIELDGKVIPVIKNQVLKAYGEVVETQWILISAVWVSDTSQAPGYLTPGKAVPVLSG